jgi:hypothetical protein
MSLETCIALYLKFYSSVVLYVKGQKVTPAVVVDASDQPTNLLATFLEYCSVVSQDIKGNEKSIKFRKIVIN